MAVFVFARSLMPRLGEMLVAAPAAPALGNQNAATGSGEIGDGFARSFVVGKCADRDLQDHIIAGVAGAVGAFAVAAAVGFEFAVVAVAEKRVVVGVGFEIDGAAIAAIAAGWAAARNLFFAA